MHKLHIVTEINYREAKISNLMRTGQLEGLDTASEIAVLLKELKVLRAS